jgi:rubrerythrin
MEKNKRIDIIKGALLLEHRGKALYQSVVRTTEIQTVKELFEFLAAEEEKHIELLTKQFGRVSNGDAVDLSGAEAHDSAAENYVLPEEIAAAISGAGYEAAVISAALDFEKKAVNYYSEQAARAGSTEEKKLYDWFADWEKGHLKMLAELDNEIKEQVWYDNSFWPIA